MKSTMLTKRQYRKLVTKAYEFAASLTGDSGYERPQSNRIALESMLIGWLRSTPEWQSYRAQLKKNDDIYVFAQDMAVQAAQDALEQDGELFAYFFTVAQLIAMFEGNSVIRDTRLARKIAAAKKRLGINLANAPERPAKKS